jgi:pimeloyl-ACP methyl ester carboxylesterase
MWSSFTLPEHDLRSRAARITMPTVLVWGGHDPLVTLKYAEAANKLIPRSRLAVVDSGHEPHTTVPAVVAAELTRLGEEAFAAAGPVPVAEPGSS